jgi:flagellar M-ring protein FliF
VQGLIRNLVVQFRDFYANLTPVRRTSLLAALGVVALSVIATVFMVSGADYGVLLRDVPPEQTSIVLDKLQSKNIKYQTQDEGKTILVPKDLLHVAQIAIMTDLGSSRVGTIGLEIFDKQDFGATSYAQRINYQRAIQGELQRAINTLDAVKRSKVLLALPIKKTFLEDSERPTASVVLEFHPGKTLSEDQVKGISFLVANAVEGLDADHISVVDSRGKLLSRQSDSATGGSSHIADLQGKMERELESKVESALERVVGVGKVIVRVNAQLNHKQTQERAENVDPDRVAALSTTTEEEKLDGARSNPVGVPGARANLPGAQDQGQVSFNQNVNKSIQQTNNAISKTVTDSKEAAGGLQRLTVAVMVDGISTIKKDDQGKEQDGWDKRSAGELAQIEGLVKATVGFKELRGDSVRIENIRFEKPNFEEADRLLTTLERKKLVNSVLKFGLILISLVLLVVIVVRPFMRWVTDSFQDTVEDMLPKTIEELEELQAMDSTLPGMSNALPVLEETLDPDKAESELLKERIMSLVERDEEKAAGAFSLWLVRKDA